MKTKPPLVHLTKLKIISWCLFTIWMWLLLIHSKMSFYCWFVWIRIKEDPYLTLCWQLIIGNRFPFSPLFFWGGGYLKTWDYLLWWIFHCLDWTTFLQTTCTEALIPIPQNATAFGKRAFKEVMKIKRRCLGRGAYSSLTDVFVRS